MRRFNSHSLWLSQSLANQPASPTSIKWHFTPSLSSLLHPWAAVPFQVGSFLPLPFHLTVNPQLLISLRQLSNSGIRGVRSNNAMFCRNYLSIDVRRAGTLQRSLIQKPHTASPRSQILSPSLARTKWPFVRPPTPQQVLRESILHQSTLQCSYQCLVSGFYRHKMRKSWYNSFTLLKIVKNITYHIQSINTLW